MMINPKIKKLEITSEIQVRELFFKYAEEMGYKVIQSQTAFPDYIIEGKSGTPYFAEVEFDYANFIKHDHNPHKCDFIIFWQDTLDHIPQRYLDDYQHSEDCLLLPALINLQKWIKENHKELLN